MHMFYAISVDIGKNDKINKSLLVCFATQTRIYETPKLYFKTSFKLNSMATSYRAQHVCGHRNKENKSQPCNFS